MVEVERIAERVVFLSAGRVVADGPPDEVAARFGRDDLEEVFLHLASERQATTAQPAGGPVPRGGVPR
jgi:ABC-2 type transport system ATP-binding protein